MRHPPPPARPELPAEVRNGTRRDALLFACGANASHGLRRSSADKRKAVETLLADDEWKQWSDREIAKRCHVSHVSVGSWRQERASALNGSVDGQMTVQPEERKFVSRHGTVGVRKVPGKAQRAESDSGKAAPRPVVSAAGAAVVIEPVKEAPPAVPTEAEQIAAEAHGDADLVTLLDETQRDLEAATRAIEAMKADDQKAQGWNPIPARRPRRLASSRLRRWRVIELSCGYLELELPYQA